jgi:hypothetical protein
MRSRLNELRGRLADQGHVVIWDQLAAATGIRKATLIDLSRGQLKLLRPEFVDALCTYFSQQLGEPVDAGDLLVADRVALPLALNLRPDRACKRPGEKSGAAPRAIGRANRQWKLASTAKRQDQARPRARQWNTGAIFVHASSATRDAECPMSRLTSEDAARAAPRPVRHVTIRHAQLFHPRPPRAERARVFINRTGAWEEVADAAPALLVQLLDQGFRVEQRTQYLTPDQHLITEWRLRSA